MKRRTKVVLIALPILVVIGVPMTFFALWFAAASGSDRGSPELAREWREQFSQYKTRDEAHAADPNVKVIGFDNGEWVFGRVQDSHGIWLRGGGTLVAKDSNGETHAFHGHVCGGDFLKRVSRSNSSLESFYTGLSECGFREFSSD